MSYNTVHLPVYRGVNTKFINIDDYKPGTIGFWPGFTSTTEDYEVAKLFAVQASYDKEPTVFKIYLSADNNPVTNVELPPDWSFFPGEAEVFLFPHFAFQVIGVTRNKATTVTEISIIELPF